jgi:hypothetical protein
MIKASIHLARLFGGIFASCFFFSFAFCICIFNLHLKPAREKEKKWFGEKERCVFELRGRRKQRRVA